MRIEFFFSLVGVFSVNLWAENANKLPANIGVALPPAIERKVSESDKPPGCYDSETKKYVKYKVSFTFDDGPAEDDVREKATNEVIRVLKEKGDIKAVFFISGEAFGLRVPTTKDNFFVSQEATKEKSLAIHRTKEFYDKAFKEHIEGGHYLANHTWDHVVARKFSTQDTEWEDNAVLPLMEYGEYLIPATRLPGGDQAEPKNMTQGTGKVPLMLKHKMIPEYWTIDSEDYKNFQSPAREGEKESPQAKKNKDEIYAQIKKVRILKNIMRELCQRKGGVILMHDIHPFTASALGTIIDEIRAEGHEIVHPQVLRPRWFDPTLNAEFQAHVQELKAEYASGAKKMFYDEKVPSGDKAAKEQGHK